MYFYVKGESLPFKLNMSMVNLSLIPYLAVDLKDINFSAPFYRTRPSKI